MVVLILAVLASIVIPRVAESAADAKRAKCDSNMSNLINALERYALDNDGVFPIDRPTYRSGVRDGTTYFPHGAPICPFGDNYGYHDGLKIIMPHSH